MRVWLILLPMAFLSTLSACKREPDFDERYEAADAKIRQSAQEIDAQVAGTGVPVEEAQKQ